MKKNYILCVLLSAATMGAGAQTERRLTVDEMFGLIEQNNSAVATQARGVDEATHSLAAAKSQRLPDINVSLSGSYNGNVVMTDRDFGNAHGIKQPRWGNSFGIEAQQIVYSGGAVSSGIKLAELQKQRAETLVQKAREGARLTAMGYYLDLYKTVNGERVYQSNIELTEKLIDEIKAKHAQGVALKNDVTRYELQLENLRLGLRRLNDQHETTNHELCNLLGIDTATRIVPDTAVTAMPADGNSEAVWHEKAANQSADMRLSELDMLSSRQQLKLAKSAMLPKLAVVAADNFTGPFIYDLPPIDKNFNLWYVGVGVKYSLSSLFKDNHKVRQAKAAIARSEEQHRDTRLTVDNSVKDAYTLYRQSFADLRTRQKSVQLATQNYQVVADRYLCQLALITDMVDASNIKLDAELQEVNARINTAFCYYRMKFAAGEL